MSSYRDIKDKKIRWLELKKPMKLVQCDNFEQVCNLATDNLYNLISS